MVLSQALLAAGLVFTGVFYTQRRLQASLDANLRARAISVAALVRYPETAKEPLIFESSLIPPRDIRSGDLYEIHADGYGLIARSQHWPQNLEISTASSGYQNFSLSGIPYRGLEMTHVPILDVEEGLKGVPSTLTVVYAMPVLEMKRQIWAAGLYIAGASLLLLVATVVLALWGIKRGLLPLQQLASQATEVSAQHWDFGLVSGTELVTELKPLSEAMQTMLQRLRRSFEQEREFLGNAAHELKTPVAILKSTIQSLLQRPRSTEEYQTGLTRSLDDVDRLERLLQSMLRLARAEQWAYGTLERNLQPVDVAATCEAAVETIRGLASHRGADIQISAEDGILCRADPEDLELVWVNLLENAVRHGATGSPVKLTVCRSHHLAQVTVEDRGPGIPPQELPHIFERFRRGEDSRLRDPNGSGLGLAIAKALVEAYGGTITPESTVGHGTRMLVEIPLCSG